MAKPSGMPVLGRAPTRWNEYYEQTHVVPGTTTGDRALRQTDAWAAGFHTTG